VKGILLRRTKNQVDAITNKKLIDLPARNYNVVRLEMEGLEDRIYQLMFEASR
jgi:SNF2 family DNA or RNA helicase